MVQITAYIGRNNRNTLELLQDGAPVTESVVTRAIFHFDSYCLDTEVLGDSAFIALSETAQSVYLWLGKLPGLVAGTYSGNLTIFDEIAVDGLAWGGKIVVNVREWPVCEV